MSNRSPISRSVSRRTLLRGVGVAMALPWLESMGHLVSGISARAAASPIAPVGAPAVPNRMIFMYVPNGKVMPDWTPDPLDIGKGYTLPPLLTPLADMKDDFNIVTGLAADKARSYGDGGGDHARAMSAYLTGAHPFKTDGSEPVRAGISVDQIAASRVGELTRLPSLEIGSEPTNAAGSCDTGYSCVYNSTISWRSATTPLPKIYRPKEIFDRLFGTSTAMSEQKKSILDFVQGETAGLKNKVSRNDQRKLDEYFQSIRDIETRIERTAKMAPVAKPDYNVPADIPDNFAEYMQVLCDLIVLAVQTDSTRVISYVVANESSNRTYPEIGIHDGHHQTSHHQNDPRKIAMLRKINTYHIQQLAYLLKKLKSTREGDGTLLDHSMIVYGCGNADGDRHNHDNLPTLICGQAGGTIATGRHIHYNKETPIANLWLSMLDRMDASVDAFGDATGRLAELSA